MEKFVNAQIWVLYGVMKGMDEKIDESVLQQFGYVERVENDRIAKRAYIRKFVSSSSVGWLWERLIDILRTVLKKEVWMSVKQGEWCMIGVNGKGL